jgi:hypothetical protein
MVDKLKASTNLGRVHVLVEERPPNRAAVRMHIRSTTAEEVLETIGIARERLEQLLKDAAKVTAIQQVVARWDSGALGQNLGLYGDHLADHRVVEEIKRILEAP